MLLVTVASLNMQVLAQASKDQRTTTTKIADLLAELPARDQKQLQTNMMEVEQLGPEGLAAMISGLSAPGSPNNAGLEYAIGSYSAHVMQTNKEAHRKQAVSAYIEGLKNTKDNHVKSFLISQLELTGKEEAVVILQSYLSNPALADPATRALVKINTPSAKAAMVNALPTAQSTVRLSLVEALGLSRATEALPALQRLLTTDDVTLKRLTLSAMANIADTSSSDILIDAADKVNFHDDQTDATAAVLTYISNLVRYGDSQSAARLAQIIQEKKDAPAHVRSSALYVLYQSNPAKGMPMLADAMDDKDPAYSAAAIKLAQADVNPSNIGMWLKKLSKVDNTKKTQIITMLARTGVQEALEDLKKLMKHKDPEVSGAAVLAATKLANAAVLPEVYSGMRKGDSTSIAFGKQALLHMKGTGLSAQIAAYIPKARPALQVALIDVLGARAASDQISLIYSLCKDKHPETRTAAYGALKYLATAEHVPHLFQLLRQQQDTTVIHELQQAIIAGLKTSPHPDRQVIGVLTELDAVSAAQKPAYYEILAALGGPDALKAVADASIKGDELNRRAAINALGYWKSAYALPELLKIMRARGQGVMLDQALKSYLHLLQRSDFNADQRYLKLSDAIAVSKTEKQRAAVLQQLEQAKTFNAAILAGKFLEDPTLKQTAANTVMSIILADTVYRGTIIRDLLTKTMNTLGGGDSDYQKQAIVKYLNEMPKDEGYVPLFNGKDLSGWKGLVGNPVNRAKMDAKTLDAAQAKADQKMLEGWKVEDGELRFQVHGDNLATVKKYGDFEMLVDWKIIDDGKQNGDAGIYLRGTPQVQIWDTARVKDGAQVGSGGLYNNQIHASKPLKVADNALDEWNTFRILMKGDRVSVWLNGELVTDNVILENYWDRSLPIFAEEQIELQAHGSPVAYRNIYIREIPRPKPYVLSAREKKEGFKVLFDGTNMHEWIGNTTDYIIEDGDMAIRPMPGRGSGGNLFTKDEYSDFIFRFEFQLTPGANNGLGIRAPLEGDAAYEGMELQILDNDAPMYKDLHEYQYHGSIYGTSAAKRGFLRPTGEWNYEEVIVKGPKIKVILNGTTILDADITDARKRGAADGKPHPGLMRNSGHIGFLGHGSPLKFRNIRIKDLSTSKSSAK